MITYENQVNVKKLTFTFSIKIGIRARHDKLKQIILDYTLQHSGVAEKT